MQMLTVIARIQFAGALMPVAYDAGFQTTDAGLIANIAANAPATSYTLTSI